MKMHSVRRLAFLFSFFFLGTKPGLALTFNAIIASLNSQPSLDTFEVDVKTSMSMLGQSVSLSSHIITKGAEKFWMEQTSSLGSQRIIRNGFKTQSIDMRTGKKQSVKLSDLASMGGGTVKSTSFFEQGRYSDPKDVGSGQFEIALIPGSDSSAVSRTITYDSNQKSLTRIVQVGTHQDTTVSEMTFTVINGRSALSRMVLNISMPGMFNKILIDYSGYSVPESITDAIFTIQD